MVALQVWWEQAQRPAWLTDEIAHRGISRWIATRDAMPTIRQWIDQCADIEREMEREAGYEAEAAARALPSANDDAGAPPDSLRRYVASGRWDRWYAYGQLSYRLQRDPTTAEIDARLREMAEADRSSPGTVARRRGGRTFLSSATNLRGPLAAALAARVETEDGHAL